MLEAWDKGRGAAHAELLMERGAARLALGDAVGAAHDFRRARWVWQRALRGPSHAREADEDHAQMRAAACLEGEAAALLEGGQVWDAIEALQEAYQARA